MFGPESLTPRSTLKTCLELVRAAENITQFIPGSSNRRAWQEFQNKLRAFYFFEHADSVLDLPRDRRVNDVEVVRRLACLEVADSIWAAEGFGRHYTNSHHRDQSSTRPWLTDTFARTARQYLVPFHSGMGLAFADSWLNSTRGGAVERSELQEFLFLCRTNARDEFVGAVYENLGLACRTQYPEMVRGIDELLTVLDPAIAAFFWHGVGRALYFLPTGFFPNAGLISRALQRAQEEPPHDLGRSNATAGVAWALTLVNMRQPKIMEDFLKNYGPWLSEGEAFANGVQSALIIWHDCAGQDPLLRAFCEHRPDPADDEAVSLWDRYAGRPSEKAAENYGLLGNENHLGELFRDHSLSTWIDTLRTGATSDGGDPAPGGKVWLETAGKSFEEKLR